MNHQTVDMHNYNVTFGADEYENEKLALHLHIFEYILQSVYRRELAAIHPYLGFITENRHIDTLMFHESRSSAICWQTQHCAFVSASSKQNKQSDVCAIEPARSLLYPSNRSCTDLIPMSRSGMMSDVILCLVLFFVFRVSNM